MVRTTPSGSASTKEARLERLVDGEPAELLAGDADEVTARIERLLGLTYDHFTTAVVLPQGEFARFLHHRLADRQALLKELLDLGLYDRLQQRAHRHAAVAAEAACFARSRLEELAAPTHERLRSCSGPGRRWPRCWPAATPPSPSSMNWPAHVRSQRIGSPHATPGGRAAASGPAPAGLDELATAHAAADAALAELEHHTEEHERACTEAGRRWPGCRPRPTAAP
ncbi:MAG: hypothetical protein R2755_00340 [Acidimicrobiales bacterium]